MVRFTVSPGPRILCAFVLLIAISLSAKPVSADETLRLVTEEWPGLVDDTLRGPEGILWEITQKVLTELGYDATLEFVPWKRALQLVESGKRDGILGIGFNETRASLYRYPEQYLLLSETVVVFRQGRGFEYQELSSLAGLSVGLSPGYSYSKDVRDADYFDKVSIPTIKSGLRILLLDRIDAMLANRDVILKEAERLGVVEQIILAEKAVSGGPVYLAFRQGIDEKLVGQFSERLEQMQAADL